MEDIKLYLKQEQPIVYQTLKNAFKQNKTSHAYIIYGTKGAPILDIAKFMAQSFVCLRKDEDSLACEQCINCQKILKNGYADFRLIKGEELKGDAVAEIQTEFNKSSVEEKDIKIYIIDLIEKAPIASLNKLLKFIEEPSSGIVAIFTSNSLSSILPTIVSRCQVISLKEFSNEQLVQYLLENHCNEEDSYLISRISNNAELNKEIISGENYQTIKTVLTKSLDFLTSKNDFFIVYMQNEGIKLLDTTSNIDLYFDMLEVCFLQAIIKKEDKNTQSKFFDKEISQLSTTYLHLDKMIDDITIAKLALLSNTNKQLVFDRLLINLLRR